MPLGTDHVVIDVLSSGTGNTVLARCDYQMTLGVPKDVIRVPIRFCIIEGSPQANNVPGPKIKSAIINFNTVSVPDYTTLQFTDGKNLLDLLRAANDATWTKYARISFAPAFAPRGIPVINDPSPPIADGSQQLGDIDASRTGGDPNSVARECEDAWGS